MSENSSPIQVSPSNEPGKHEVVAKINSRHCSVIRLAKKLLAELIEVARLVQLAETELTGGLSDLVLRDLVLTHDEAGFYHRVAQQVGIDPKNLSPSVDIKLPRLIEFLELACDQFEVQDHTPEESTKTNPPFAQPSPKKPPSAAKPREQKGALTDEQYRELLRLSPSLLIKVKRGKLTYEEAINAASA